MKLTTKQTRFLRGLAHPLQANVQVGHKGVTEALLKELNDTLAAHELVKIRVRCDDQDEFQRLKLDLEKATDAHIVQTIGHTLVVYKPSEEKKIKLP